MAKSRKPSGSTRNWWRIAGVAALTATVIAVGIGTVVATTREPAPDRASSPYTPPPAPTIEPAPRNAIESVMPRIDDNARSFNVVVLGDSTGAARRGWVVQLAEAFAAKTGRTVDFHQWSVEQEPDVYLAPWKIAQGTPAPITFWNGSASGENAAYTLKNWDALAPIPSETVDLVLVNHGHNIPPGELQSSGFRIVDKAARGFPNAAVVTMLQNPERPGTPKADAQDANVSKLRARLDQAGFAAVDVHAAYKAMSGWESAFDTPTGTLHPNQAGYDLWANVVRQTLGV